MVGVPLALSNASVVSKNAMVAPSAKYRVKVPEVATNVAGVVPQVAVVTGTDAGSNVNPARLGAIVKDCPNDTPLNAYRPFTSVTAVAVPAPDNVTVTPASAPSSRSRTRPEMAGAQAAVKSADWSVVMLAKDVEAGVNAYPVADGVTVKFPPIARFPRR